MGKRWIFFARTGAAIPQWPVHLWRPMQFICDVPWQSIRCFSYFLALGWPGTLPSVWKRPRPLMPEFARCWTFTNFIWVVVKKRNNKDSEDAPAYQWRSTSLSMDSLTNRYFVIQNWHNLLVNAHLQVQLGAPSCFCGDTFTEDSFWLRTVLSPLQVPSGTAQ